MCQKRCEGYAFTEGSEANKEPDNHIKGLICLLTPHTFYCHESMDWKNAKSRMSKTELRQMNPKICEGWREEVQKLAATGYYKEHSIVTKFFGETALITFEEILKEKDSAAKKKLWKKLQTALQELSVKWKKYRNKSIEVQI